MINMSPTKEVSLTIPPVIIEGLNQAYPKLSLSNQLRECLIGAELCPERDLTDINTPFKECKRKNLYMKVREAKDYEEIATQRGQSISSYLVNLLANKLTHQGYLELSSRWQKLELLSQDIETATRPSYYLAEKFISWSSKEGMQYPLSVELLCTILRDYFDDVESWKTDVTGKYFQSRHNEEKSNIRIRLPRNWDEMLVKRALKMGTSKTMVLTQALTWYLETKKDR